jgi:hypothetical protein
MTSNDPYVSLKIRASTKREILKMQAYYQLETGEKATVDQIIKTFLERQPHVDITQRPSK